MATMNELKAECELLEQAHRKLLEEREQLQSIPGDNLAHQGHFQRTVVYLKALDTYQLALQARRDELNTARGARLKR